MLDNADAALRQAGYEVKSLLAKSNDAELFRGNRCSDGKAVILKCVKRNAEKERLEQLRHEYEFGSTLDCQAAVAVLDFLDLEAPCLVLEDDRGISLANLREEGGMEVGRFLEHAVAIAEGLTRLHGTGVVHRDIKPQNIIILPEEGAVKFTDFGLACFESEDNLQKKDLLIGALPYLAPEQTPRLQHRVDQRSDLYSLGVTLFELLSGRLPLQAEDALGWIHVHLASTPPPVTVFRPEVPEVLAQIIARLLVKEPGERYQSARGLLWDLRLCQKQWERARDIKPFEPGSHDLGRELLLAEHLYGRREELEQLRRGIIEENVKVTLVSGEPGVGKSALIRRLKAEMAGRGFFAGGKFDQYKRDTPYLTVIQGFRELIVGLLVNSEERLANWRERLVEALGENGKLITDVVPEVGLIIGPQPPVAELGPQETQNRFNLVFQRFVQVFARPDHPLVLFLDDMQWADIPTLDLLDALLMTADIADLHLIFAYRDTEVDSAHPFSSFLEALTERGLSHQHIGVEPLGLEETAALLEDALPGPGENERELAQFLMRKTRGNPFFLRQLLQSFYREGYIEIGPQSWRWDEERASVAAVSESVVELMIGRMRKLREETRELLQLASCVGATFDATLLARVPETDEGRHGEALADAVEHGLIKPAVEIDLGGEGAFYHFTHDRIQQAAYSMLDEREQQRLHLRLGRLMMEQLEGREQSEESVFDERFAFAVVGQLNRVTEMLDEQELDHLAALNEHAGFASKRTSAFTAAKDYFEKAAAIWGLRIWEENYGRALQLSMERAECAYLVGDLDGAEQILKAALEQCRSDLDRAKVFRIWLDLYQIMGHMKKGFKLGVEVLKLLGIEVPKDEEALHELMRKGHEEIQRRQKEASIPEFLDLPLLEDERIDITLSVLTALAPLAYIGFPAAFPLIAVESTRLSLTYGNAPQSCFGYSMYGMILLQLFQDADAAYAYSELAINLSEKLGDARFKGLSYHVHADHISYWKKPFRESTPFVDEAYRVCLQVGDFIDANYLAFTSWWLYMEQGLPLSEVAKAAERGLSVARLSRTEAVQATVSLQMQFSAALAGETEEPSSLSPVGTTQEEDYVAVIHRHGFQTGLAVYYVMKLMMHVHLQQKEKALQMVSEAEKYIASAAAQPLQVSFALYRGLALIDSYGDVDEQEQQSIKSVLEQACGQLKSWTEGCRENFEAKYLLLSAEYAALIGEGPAAQRAFEEAARAARNTGAVHDLALIRRRVLLFYEAEGFDDLAAFSRREARQAYLRWGATGLIEQLDGIGGPSQQEVVGRSNAEETVVLHKERLQLLSVLKASQAISGEIITAEVARRLMPLAVEHAGADRGCLVLLGEAGFRIEYEVLVQASGTLFDVEPGRSVGVPESILYYVSRTGEPLVLEDAREAHLFSSDAYFESERPRSVLCIPVVKQEQLFGMLYLENRQVAGAFRKEQLRLLELLATQAAISLENARHYREAQLVGLMQRQAEQLQALNEAALRLHSATTMTEVTDAITESARELIGAHQVVSSLTAGENWEQVIHSIYLSKKYERWRDYAVPPDGSGIYHQVVKHNRTYRLTQEQLEAHPKWRDFGAEADRHPPMRGWLAAPLLSRDGESLGLIQLSDKLDGEFSASDEALLVQLAQLAAVAIENLRLNEDLQNSIRMRNELLAIVSHDLRNPLSSVAYSAEIGKRVLEKMEQSLESELLKGNLDVIGRSAHRMEALIRDLLDLATVEAGRFALQIESFSVEALLKEVVELHEPLAAEKSQQLSIHVSDNVESVSCDHQRALQIFANLVGNAIKFTPVAGEIVLGAEPTAEDMVRFCVGDTGPGIAADSLPRIFDDYWQDSHDRKSGVGLGLSIARGLVESHGGEIWVHSTPGEGTTFFFTLPTES